MNLKWSQQNQKELTEQKIRKLHLSRIFRYGNSQVYHFANNNVMAQNETVKTLNCFLTWEEKLRFVTFCMWTFFWGSIGDKISWDTTLMDSFLSVVFLWLSKGKWSCYPPTPSKKCCAGIRARESVEDTNLKEGCSLHRNSPKYPHWKTFEDSLLPILSQNVHLALAGQLYWKRSLNRCP